MSGRLDEVREARNQMLQLLALPEGAHNCSSARAIPLHAGATLCCYHPERSRLTYPAFAAFIPFHEDPQKQAFDPPAATPRVTTACVHQSVAPHRVCEVFVGVTLDVVAHCKLMLLPSLRRLDRMDRR